MPQSKKTEQESTPDFKSLGLHRDLLKVAKAQGWKEPTPIQEQSIPLIRDGHDLIGVAQTGTGKTAAFLLPIIDKIHEPGDEIRALILEPTRELALQVAAQFEIIAKPLGLRHGILYGGSPMGPQRIALKEGVDVLIATPGRLLDLTEHMHFMWRHLSFLVLDEADRMLDMGFLPDVEKILRRLPMSRQTLLFTATMPPDLKRLTRDQMLEPEEVTIGINRSLAEGITQWLYPVRQDQKIPLILSLLDELHIDSGIIFCRTRDGADRVGQAMRRRGHDTGILHASRPQEEREQTLAAFRSGELPLLVATDVASRGLDISGITHVINLDVPQSPDDYIHRVGRTARHDAKGDAITFVSPEEERSLSAIESLIEQKLERSVLADFPYKGDPLRRSHGQPHKKRPPRGGGGAKGGGRRRGPGHSRNR